MAKRAKKEKKEKKECWRPHGAGFFCPVWIIGWLFTIGYCSMPFFWQGVLALLIWPYYLGAVLH
jgi:hypothetical protein